MELTKEKHLMLPKELMNKIGGDRKRAFTFIVLDPRSRHVVVTRYPEEWAQYRAKNEVNNQLYFQQRMSRGTDFVPAVAIKAAKIKGNKFNVSFTTDVTGYKDMIIKGVKKM